MRKNNAKLGYLDQGTAADGMNATGCLRPADALWLTHRASAARWARAHDRRLCALESVPVRWVTDSEIEHASF